MQSYKEFKKGYLNEWVEKSQAARKAAEELAMKDSTSLSDRYKEEGLIFTLGGHKVELKGENEKNSDGDIYFTWDEAIKRFGEADKDGWRLPTKEELNDLCNYPYKFKDKQGVLDNRLSLPAAGFRTCDGNVYCVGSEGNYWSSTSGGSHLAWDLNFNSDGVYMYGLARCDGQSVRLVRDVK